MKLNGLEKEFKTNKNGEIVDFKQVNIFGISPLIFALRYNKLKNLNLSESQFDYMIKNSDLKYNDNKGWSPLMLALRYNKEQNLNLNLGQFNYLINKSDLKHINKYGLSSFMYVLRCNKSQNLNVSKEQWKYLIENSDLSLVKDEKQLIELKKIKSELLNEEILSKIDIKKEISKKSKI